MCNTSCDDGVVLDLVQMACRQIILMFEPEGTVYKSWSMIANNDFDLFLLILFRPLGLRQLSFHSSIFAAILSKPRAFGFFHSFTLLLLCPAEHC